MFISPGRRIGRPKGCREASGFRAIVRWFRLRFGVTGFLYHESLLSCQPSGSAIRGGTVLHGAPPGFPMRSSRHAAFFPRAEFWKEALRFRPDTSASRSGVRAFLDIRDFLSLLLRSVVAGHTPNTSAPESLVPGPRELVRYRQKVRRGWWIRRRTASWQDSWWWQRNPRTVMPGRCHTSRGTRYGVLRIHVSPVTGVRAGLDPARPLGRRWWSRFSIKRATRQFRCHGRSRYGCDGGKVWGGPAHVNLLALLVASPITLPKRG